MEQYKVTASPAYSNIEKAQYIKGENLILTQRVRENGTEHASKNVAKLRKG